MALVAQLVEQVVYLTKFHRCQKRNEFKSHNVYPLLFPIHTVSWLSAWVSCKKPPEDTKNLKWR